MSVKWEKTGKTSGELTFEISQEEVKKAWNDKNAKWFYVTLGNCYREEWCDTYKLYYSVDSSD